MSSLRKTLALALLCGLWAGCDCSPIIAPPDGGTGGGLGGGSAGGGSGGGSAMGGGAGGGAMGGGAGGGGGGGGGGMGGGAGGGGGGANVQFTQYVRDLINADTSDTKLPRPASEWQTLDDSMPITYPSSFFDGGP